jgi:hypothetical protein
VRAAARDPTERDPTEEDSRQTFDPAAWMWRAVAALGVVTGLVVATGVYLTLDYRPATRVDVPGVDARPALVGISHLVHLVGGYVFVVLACTVIGLALVVANRRDQAPGVILASGFGFFVVSLGFVLTGLELPWRGFVWVAADFARDFDGVIGFPREVVAVLVGGGEVTPARYETVAWIHIAGLPVFAVFAAWWLIGALQARRRAQPPRAEPATSGIRVERGAEEPRHAVSLAERYFGTDDPETVRLQVEAFLHRYLGTGVAALDFTRIDTGIIFGVTLTDGRPAVVRFYPPGVDGAYLRAVHEVKDHLAAQGFPAPRPLLEPVPFGVGLASVEGRLHEPTPADPHDPATQRALAHGLALLVQLAEPLAHHPELAGRGPLGSPAPGSVFPLMPGAPFDFAATSSGAEWIEEVGERAKLVLDAAPVTAPVVGHFAWRLENVGVSEGRIHAVFDWEQIGAAPEAVVIGSAAHQFTIDGRSTRPHVPTAEEIQQFVADYESARSAPLATAERVAARAAYVFCTAYSARCEHALAVAGQAAPARFRERLADTAAALLA